MRMPSLICKRDRQENLKKENITEVKHNSTETEALACHIVQIKYHALCMLYSLVSIHLVTSGCTIVCLSTILGCMISQHVDAKQLSSPTKQSQTITNHN